MNAKAKTKNMDKSARLNKQNNRMAWVWACPRCQCRLEAGANDSPLLCPDCNFQLVREAGIWSGIYPERQAVITRFLADYTAIRHAEGRWRADTDYYRSLPFAPAGAPKAGEWRIRAVSYRRLMRYLAHHVDSGARVLDLGAGVGWLSHRLAGAGYRPLAVDISDDAHDGLGAAGHYQEQGQIWPCLLAEFEHLPLAADQADVCIFNASLHYTTDDVAAFTEAFRVLRPGGHLVIMDTPVYRNDADGLAMLAARAEDFERRYGRRSDSLPTIGYLTDARLRALAQTFGLTFRMIRPWYGWRWALRPIKARLLGRHRPARFALIVARKPDPSAIPQR